MKQSLKQTFSTSSTWILAPRSLQLLCYNSLVTVEVLPIETQLFEASQSHLHLTEPCTLFSITNLFP